MMIRDAREEDLPGILWIYNHAAVHTKAIWNQTPVDLSNRAAWLKDRNSRGFPVLVAVENDQVVGYSSFGDFRPFEGYQSTVENSVYVHPDHQRKGIGRALMKQLIDQAKKKGKHVMVAAIESGNAPSIRLHAEFGFVQSGFMSQVGFKFGKWMDLTLMQLRLDDRDKP